MLNWADPHIKTLFILSYLFTYLCFEWEGFFQLGMSVWQIAREGENSEWAGVIYLAWSSEKSPAVSLIPSPPGHRTNESTLRARQTRAVCAALQWTYSIQPLSHTRSLSRTQTHTHTRAEVSTTPHPFNGSKTLLFVLLWFKNTDSKDFFPLFTPYFIITWFLNESWYI